MNNTSINDNIVRKLKVPAGQKGTITVAVLPETVVYHVDSATYGSSFRLELFTEANNLPSVLAVSKIDKDSIDYKQAYRAVSKLEQKPETGASTHESKLGIRKFLGTQENLYVTEKGLVLDCGEYIEYCPFKQQLPNTSFVSEVVTNKLIKRFWTLISTTSDSITLTLKSDGTQDYLSIKGTKGILSLGLKTTDKEQMVQEVTTYFSDYLENGTNSFAVNGYAHPVGFLISKEAPDTLTLKPN